MLAEIFAPVATDLKLVHSTLSTTVAGDQVRSGVSYPFTYPLQGGKQLRAGLVLLCAKLAAENYPANYTGGFVRERAIQVGAAAELLHLATLLHDDVLDESDQRRGRPVPGTLWGNKTAILTGDFFFARAYTLLVNLGEPRFLHLFTDAISQTCAGEVEEHLDSYNPKIETDHYLQRIAKKSASLFSACTRAGAILAECHPTLQEALGRYGHHLGLSYQLVDDLLDIVGCPHQMGKPVGKDLEQGVYTLPVLQALTEDTRQLLRQILGRPITSREAEEVRRLIAGSGGIAATRELALQYKDQAQKELELLPPGPVRESLAALPAFVTSMIDRISPCRQGAPS